MDSMISIRQLQALLANPEVTESELRQYVVEDRERSRAFAPALRINPRTVDDEGLEADVLLSAFNSFSRRSRQHRYRAKLKRGWNGLKIVSEGDSWFQFPILLEDVIDQLFDDYAIYSLGAAGDLLRDMIDEDELSRAIAAEAPDVCLLSGGGNDLVGGGRLATLVRRFDPALAPSDYPTPAFDAFLQETVGLYRQLFWRLTGDHPDLKLVTHGYDLAIPDGGRWLGKPLESVGILDRTLQRSIVAVMLERFNDKLRGLQGEFPGQVFHADCRGSVADHQWFDELHPTSAGYASVARVFRDTIDEAVRGGERSPERTSARHALPSGRGGPTMQTELDAINARAAERFGRAAGKREGLTRQLEREQPAAVDTSERSSVRRRLLPEQDQLAYERVLGRNNFFHVNYFAQALRASRAVCKLQVKDSFGVPVWSGTGFLVGPGLLLTNNHVLPRADLGGTAEFEFEYDIEYQTKPTTQFALEPNRLFVTNEPLDFTFVGVSTRAGDGSRLEDFGRLPLVPDSGKALIGEPVSIIQHPNGELKRVALRDSKVLVVPDPPDDDFIHYSTDTLPGASGSPVLNDQWQVVALHHAGVPDGQGGWSANEGVRVSRIFRALRERASVPAPGDERATLEALGVGLVSRDAVPPQGPSGGPDLVRVGGMPGRPPARPEAGALGVGAGARRGASAAEVRSYISGLPIGTPARAFEASLADAVDVDRLPEGVVAGSNLVQFSDKVAPELRSAVALSLLAAQRVADNDTVVADPDQWVERYNTVLRNLNWRIEGGGIVESTFEDVDVAVHEAIIPFLAAALGPGAAAGALILTALRQLKRMDESTPWITLFDRESRRFEVNEYQFSMVDSDGYDVVVYLAAARLDVRYGRTQVLFFKVKQQDMTFEAARSTLRTDAQLLSQINADLKNKLAGQTSSYIRSLDLG